MLCDLEGITEGKVKGDFEDGMEEDEQGSRLGAVVTCASAEALL